MEPMNFYFDVRDVFRAPRLAFSGKKIWLFLKANLLGFASYWILSYLALLINGNGLISSINNFGLYPCIYAIENPSIISLIFYWIGVNIQNFHHEFFGILLYISIYWFIIFPQLIFFAISLAFFP